MQLPKLALVALTLLSTASCGSAVQMSDEELLEHCWGAESQGEGRFRLKFEALAISATEGSIFSRSPSCPEHRLMFSQLDPQPEKQFEPIQKAASAAKTLGQGFRGTAVVVPLERTDEHHLRVRIIAFPELEAMMEAETDQFIDRFRIG